MYGGTDLIEDQISKNRNVVFLSQHWKESQRIFHNACERYAPFEHVKIHGKIQMVDFGHAYLRFQHVDGIQSLERLQGHQGVIICHPELLFEHLRDEELVAFINHRNSKYGDFKSGTT